MGTLIEGRKTLTHSLGQAFESKERPSPIIGEAAEI
jgi:hypothetical protein